jgi:PAS domain S-box-containing protein
MGAYRKPPQRSSPSDAGDDPLWRLSRDLLVVTRPDTAILAANPAWETALRWRPGDLPGQSFVDLAHPEDRPAAEAGIARLREGADPVTLEARMRQGDGSYRRLAWTFA